jgi:hypothetical protein
MPDRIMLFFCVVRVCGFCGHGDLFRAHLLVSGHSVFDLAKEGSSLLAFV